MTRARGQQTETTERRRRRHLDGSVTKAMREIPARQLRQKRQATTEQLRAEVKSEHVEAPAPDFQQLDLEDFLARYEQLPPGADQLAEMQEGGAGEESKLPYWARMS